MAVNGKICLVTGAAQGIGKAIAEIFAKNGAKVVIAADVKSDKVEEFAQGFDNIEAGTLDVTDSGKVKEFIDGLKDKYGTIDVLVNNAGITRDGLLQKTSDDDWNAVISVNLKGVFNMTRAVAPVMLDAGKGVVVNISSVVGIDGNVGQSNYSATKAGVIGLTKTWSKELARKGAKIRVNAVAPGFINTPMVEKVPDKILESMKDKVVLGRLGEPEDVARAVLFLSGDDSDYVTGQVLRVDGGLAL
jgi:3-oxoacyl-[acyl-carrier protein] reductase